MADERIPFQKPLIGTIIPGCLLVGNDAAGRDGERLRAHDVTDVIDLRLLECEPPEFSGIRRFRFPLIDGPGNDPDVFRAAMTLLDSLAELWHARGATFVHCLAGHSRSVCLATAYWAENATPRLTFDEALVAVKGLYPAANPNHFTAEMARNYLRGGAP